MGTPIRIKVDSGEGFNEHVYTAIKELTKELGIPFLDRAGIEISDTPTLAWREELELPESYVYCAHRTLPDLPHTRIFRVGNLRQKHQDALERMKLAVPHFRAAVARAATEEPNARPKLGILASQPDGSGRVICSFECDEFFEDLALLVDAPELTDDDILRSKALAFLGRFGINGGSTDLESKS